MRMPSRDERMVPRRSQAVSIKVHCLVHVQETSLGMPRLSCQAPCPPISKGGNRRATVANKAPCCRTGPASPQLL